MRLGKFISSRVKPSIVSTARCAMGTSAQLGDHGKDSACPGTNRQQIDRIVEDGETDIDYNLYLHLQGDFVDVRFDGLHVTRGGAVRGGNHGCTRRPHTGLQSRRSPGKRSSFQLGRRTLTVSVTDGSLGDRPLFFICRRVFSSMVNGGITQMASLL